MKSIGVEKCLPIQRGGPATAPCVVGVDRNGQLVGIDLWASISSNYNGVILAESGKGMSIVYKSQK